MRMKIIKANQMLMGYPFPYFILSTFLFARSSSSTIHSSLISILHHLLFSLSLFLPSFPPLISCLDNSKATQCYACMQLSAYRIAYRLSPIATALLPPQIGPHRIRPDQIRSSEKSDMSPDPITYPILSYIHTNPRPEQSLSAA